MAKTKLSPTPKRSYNQGRTKQLHGRFTAAEIALINEARGTKSFSDWCVEKAKQDIVKLQSPN